MDKSLKTHSDTTTQQWLSELVAFDTTSRNSNLALIQHIQSYLESFDLDCQLSYDSTGDKANLYTTIGPQDKPGVMLSGHTDVVPVDGQNWSKQPFTLTESDDKLYGRGTSDMKGFLASVLSAVPSMVKSTLKTPIHLAFSYDEEIGCLGAKKLIDHMRDKPVLPAMAIIGEPTDMDVVIGHKGRRGYNVRITGYSCHSSCTTEGVNAIEYAARLIHYITQLHEKVSASGPFDQGYDVPHSTFHVGTIQGGTAINIVPDMCEFNFELRNLPQHDGEALIKNITDFAHAELLPVMQRVHPSANIEFTESSSYTGLFTEPNADIVHFVKMLLEESHIEHELRKVSFGTEAGLFNNSLGIPAVVCGPGSISQAHKPDEFIHTQQLKACDSFLKNLILQLSTSSN